MYNGGASDEIKEAEPYGKVLSEKKVNEKSKKFAPAFPEELFPL